MGRLPVLDDCSVIAVSREGGFASIPALASPQHFVLAELPPPERERLCALINRAAPLAQPPRGKSAPGRGDQRYFRIQIFYSDDDEAGAVALELLVQEQSAPPELQALWCHGQLDDDGPPAARRPN